jgi:hypothetical protein
VRKQLEIGLLPGATDLLPEEYVAGGKEREIRMEGKELPDHLLVLPAQERACRIDKASTAPDGGGVALKKPALPPGKGN